MTGGSTKALNFCATFKNFIIKKSIAQKFFKFFFNYKLLIIYYSKKISKMQNF